MFDETYSSSLSSIQVPKLTSTTTNSSSSLSRVYHNNHNPQHRNPHELFVGNVSFFCQESQLLELFGTIGLVTHCQIVRNEGHRRARPLLYAFVCMSTRKEAMQAIKAINGMMFMGRNLIVDLSSLRRTQASTQQSKIYVEGFQVHLSLVSLFETNNVLVVPTESLLRSVFKRYGKVLDVMVRDYNVIPNMNKQEGYGFVVFEDEESAVLTAFHGQKLLVCDGQLQITCTFNVRNRPTGRVYDLGDGKVFVSQPGRGVENHSPRSIHDHIHTMPINSTPSNPWKVAGGNQVQHHHNRSVSSVQLQRNNQEEWHALETLASVPSPPTSKYQARQHRLEHTTPDRPTYYHQTMQPQIEFMHSSHKESNFTIRNREVDSPSQHVSYLPPQPPFSAIDNIIHINYQHSSFATKSQGRLIDFHNESNNLYY